MPIIERLTTLFDFDLDEDALKGIDKFIDNVETGLLALGAVAVATATAVSLFTIKIAEANDQTAKFAKRTGIDIAALQELGFVAELNGGSIDSMNSSLENLNRIASETARGMGVGVEAFGILGLSVTDANGRIKDADDLMLELSDALNKLGTQAEKAELAQKLGIGPDILLSLTQGSEAIKRQREEAKQLGFVINKDAAQAAERFVDAQTKVKKIVSGVASAIGTRLIKQATPMVETFIEWFKINRSIIQQNITKFLDTAAKVMSTVSAVVGRIVGVVLRLVDAIGGWEVAIKAAIAATLILNATTLLIPLLIVAAGAAILLLIEDIIKFAEGGDSAIGNLAKKFPLLGKAAEGLIFVFKKVVEGWELIFTEGPELVAFAIEKIKELAVTVSDFFTNTLDKGIEKFKEIGTAITDFFIAPLKKALELILKLPLSDDVRASIQNFVEPGQQAQGGARGRSVLSNSVVNEGANITVNVNGGEPASVKQAIKDALNEEYRNATFNLTSPVGF